MELDHPLLLENFVFRTGFATKAKTLDERMCNASFVQASEVLLESSRRFLLNKSHDGLDEFVVAWVQTDVEDARHKNGVANFEKPGIGIPDQLGDDVVACDLARNDFAHTRKPQNRLLIESDETYGECVAQD
jgi:hypothetical protein